MTVTIREGPRPGDVGTVLEMHGRIYAAEYGYTVAYESYVAETLTDFTRRLAQHNQVGSGEAVPGMLWLAERQGDVVGSVGLVVHADGRGQVRWFLVQPDCRGEGVGRQLLTCALDSARARGVDELFLWTVDGLDAAASLYEKAGFVRRESRPTSRFGPDVTEIRYELMASARES